MSDPQSLSKLYLYDRPPIVTLPPVSISMTGHHSLSTNKLMLQGYNESRLKSSFRKFYGPYNDLVCDYKLTLAHMLNDLFHTMC